MKLNDKPVTAITATITGQDLGQDGSARLSAGKKRHGVVKAI